MSEIHLIDADPTVDRLNVTVGPFRSTYISASV